MSFELVKEIVKVQNPLSYNPYRDALLFGTTLGKRMNEMQKRKINQLIRESKSNEITSMFSEDKSTTNKELRYFFNRYYGTQDINVDTVVRQAVKMEVDGTLGKYFDESPHFFVGKVLSISIPPANKLCSEQGKCGIFGEVKSAEFVKDPSRSSDQKYLRLKVEDNRQSETTGHHVVLSVNDSNTEVAFRQLDEIRLDQFVKCPPSVQRYCQRGQVYDVQLHEVHSNELGLPTNVDLTMETVETNAGVRYIHLTSADGITLFRFVLSGGKTFLESYWKGQYSYRLLRSHEISFSALRHFQIAFHAKQTDLVILPSAKVKIQEKLLSVHELRWNKMEETNKLRGEFMKALSSPMMHPVVDEAVAYILKTANTTTASSDKYFEGLLEKLPSPVQQLWKHFLFAFVESGEETTVVVDVNVMLKEIFTELNFHRFLTTLDDYYTSVRVMERMNNAAQHFKSMKDQNVILFLGDTGVGKSTSVNYFLLVPLEIDELDLNKVKIEKGFERGEDVAEIGLFRTRSETVYVKCYALKGMEKVKICDTPGFHDLRGVDFDFTAGLSFSRAVEASESIQGIVLVISESAFTSKKGSDVYDTFDKLDEKFHGGLNSLSTEEKSRIKIIVSHCRDSSTTRKELPINIEKALAEFDTVPAEQRDATYQKRKEIWTLIRDINRSDGIFPIHVTDTMERDWLSLQLFPGKEMKSDGIRKSLFANPFAVQGFHQQFGNIVNAAVHIWESLIFKNLDQLNTNSHGYLKTLEDGKSQYQVVISQIEENTNRLESYRNTLKQSIDLLKDLKAGKLISADLRLRFEQIQNTEYKDKKNLQVSLKNELQTAESELLEANRMIWQFETNNTAIVKRIDKLEAEVARWSTGSSNVTLRSYGPLDKNHMETRNWLKLGVDTDVRKTFRPFEEKDYASTKTTRVGDYDSPMAEILHIEKKFRILPIQNFQEFVQGNKPSGEVGKEYIAYFEGFQAEISRKPCCIPVAHPDGNVMIYNIDLTWKKEKPGVEWQSPWYRIIHNIPNTEIYVQQIKNHGSSILLDQTSLKNIRESLKELKETKNTAQTTFNKKKSDLEAVNKEMEILESKAKNNFIQETEKTINNTQSDIEDALTAHSNYQDKLAAIYHHMIKVKSKYYENRINQIRLSAAIHSYLPMATNWRDLLHQTIYYKKENKDLSQAIEAVQRSQNLNFNFIKRCIDFIHYYDENIETVKETVGDFIINSDLKWTLKQLGAMRLEFAQIGLNKKKPNLAAMKTESFFSVINTVKGETLPKEHADMVKLPLNGTENLETEKPAMENDNERETTLEPNESTVESPTEEEIDKLANTRRPMDREMLFDLVKRVLIHDCNKLSLLFTFNPLASQIDDHFQFFLPLNSDSNESSEEQQTIFDFIAQRTSQDSDVILTKWTNTFLDYLFARNTFELSSENEKIGVFDQLIQHLSVKDFILLSLSSLNDLPIVISSQVSPLLQVYFPYGRQELPNHEEILFLKEPSSSVPSTSSSALAAYQLLSEEEAAKFQDFKMVCSREKDFSVVHEFLFREETYNNGSLSSSFSIFPFCLEPKKDHENSTRYSSSADASPVTDTSDDSATNGFPLLLPVEKDSVESSEWPLFENPNFIIT
jgi:hypothetical protein